MGAALDSADAVFAAALERVAATQREIDALLARRAREITAVVVAAERLEIVSGTPTSRSAEFVHRSTRAELALALRTSEHVAERELATAESLTTVLTATLDAVESGAITWRAATLIAECAQRDGTDLGERVAAFEAAGLRIAAAAAPSRLRSRLAALLERFLRAPAVERHQAAAEQRHVILEDVTDGMSWLHTLLPSVEAHAVYHRLTDVARALQRVDGEEGIDDPRTLAQRRADLLVDFIAGDHIRVADRGGLSAQDAFERRVGEGRDLGRFAGIRPTVVVTVPVQTLLDADGGGAGGQSPPAMLDGVVPIDPATARQLTANAPSLHRLLVDPHSGAALDLSRTRYRLTPELRLWLRLRDQTCRFPGCGHLAKGCDIDHTVDWQYGGATAAHNLAHLCRGHHALKHQTRWHVEQHPDGTLTWQSPSGRVHSTKPGSAFPSTP